MVFKKKLGQKLSGVAILGHTETTLPRMIRYAVGLPGELYFQLFWAQLCNILCKVKFFRKDPTLLPHLDFVPNFWKNHLDFYISKKFHATYCLLTSPRELFIELQRNKDTISCFVLCADVPGKQLMKP